MSFDKAISLAFCVLLINSRICIQNIKIQTCLHKLYYNRKQYIATKKMHWHSSNRFPDNLLTKECNVLVIFFLLHCTQEEDHFERITLFLQDAVAFLFSLVSECMQTTFPKASLVRREMDGSMLVDGLFRN